MGKCRRCKKQSEPNRNACSYHLNIERIAAQIKRDRRKEKNLCLECDEPRVSGRSYCTHHILRRREYLRVKIQKRKDNGQCIDCGSPAMDQIKHTETALCEKHYLRRKAAENLGKRDLWIGLKDLLVKQNYKCAWTGDDLILGLNDSIDHKNPKSKFPGMFGDINNIEWVTRTVNITKNDLTSEEFEQLICRIYHNFRVKQRTDL